MPLRRRTTPGLTGLTCMLLAASLCVAVPAHAGSSGSGNGGSIGVTTGAGSPPAPPPDGGKDSGAPPGTGGGGSTGGPAPTPPSTITTHYGTSWFPPRTLSTPTIAGTFGGCPDDRQGQPAEGASWSYKTSTRGGDDSVYVVSGSLSYSCIWPPAYEDSPVVCAISLDATVSEVVPEQATVVHKSKATTWATTHDPADCAGSWRLSVTRDIATWGRYQADAIATVVAGTLRVWLGPDPRTGQWPASRYVGGFSSPYIVNPDTAKGQLTCHGWSNGWSGNWSFTADDCPAGGPDGLLTCSVSGAPTLSNPAAGVPTPTRAVGTQQIFDDGSTWSITWPTPRINGASHIYTRTTALQRYAGGTPWRTDASGKDLPNGPTQPVVADLDQPVPGWIPGPWTEAYLQASLAARPTSTSLRYWLDADWAASTVTGVDINFGTGSMTASTHAGTVRGTGSCTSDPVVVAVKRARNSS